MPVFAGSTSGSIMSLQYNIPAKLVSYSLSNTGGGNITVHVYITDNNAGTSKLIYTNVLTASTTFLYNGTGYIILPTNGAIIVTTSSGTLEYYFSLEGL